MGIVQPDFIVIGAQKAGSTFLSESLRRHPAIAMPGPELACFEDPEYAQHGIDRLTRTLDTLDPSGLRGFKRVALLARAECPARIARHCPEARLIAILRDPIERAVSSLFNLMHAAKLPLMDVNRALQQALDGTLTEASRAGQIVLEYGRYHEQLQRYLDHFDRSQMHIVLFDDLKRSPVELVREVFAFLGVEAGISIELPAGRPMAVPYSLARLRVLRALQPMFSRLEVDGTRRYLRRGPVAPILRTAAWGLDRLVLAPLFKADRPDVSPELRSRLCDYYRDDVAALEKLLDRDLSHWLNDVGSG